VVLNPVSPERLVPEIETTPDLTRSELIELQERLSILGYALGRADGIAGQRTEAAIRAYEKAEGQTISGLPTVLVLSELRKQVTIAELKNWRSNLAAQTKRVPAKSTRTKATPRAKTVTQPKVTAPKPKTVKPKAVSKPSKKYTQFCGANRQCGTSQCKAGASGDFFRKTRSCRFCTLYAQRCK
jgi:peptidoglycan hydrolase-like protein with peptidoglycan-binding domain